MIRVSSTSLLVTLLISVLHAQNWQPLGSGVIQNSPRVMYSDSLDNYLYLVGNFFMMDGKHCKGIARWNGLEWDSLGAGLDALDTLNQAPNNPAVITRFQGDIYVGGIFNSAGSVEATGIAKWDGLAWAPHPLPPFSPGLSGEVLELAVINNELYMGGIFDSVLNLPCNGIAKWNGSNWINFGLPPMNFYYVSAIREFQGEIYVGGNFSSMPWQFDTIKSIIKWDGAHWRSVGGGLKGAFSSIGSMAVYQNELYVAGSFYQSSGNAGNHIQKWNGTQWTEVGGGMDYAINKLLVHNNLLYAVGGFYHAGGVTAQGIACWNGSNWCSLGSTFDNILNGICFYKDTLHICGGFNTIDSDSIAHIAQWTAGSYVEQCGNNAGVNKEDIYLNFSIYPNPATNQIIISSPFEKMDADIINYTISNLLGEKIGTGYITEHNSSISIEQLPSGMYWVELSIGNKKICKKLLKI